MKTEHLQAPIADPAAGSPLAAWQWLAVGDPVPVMVTALGDLFVRNRNGEMWLLDTYRGLYERVSANERTWRLALDDSSKINAWFDPELVATLRARGLHPGTGECYSPILPPAVGGTMDPGNFECTPWLLHMSLAGQLLQQSRSHKDGTPIAGFVDEGGTRPGVAPEGSKPRVGTPH
jgi:hypothetical protein